MFAKVINDEIIKYPYTIDSLKRDNPNTLFCVPLHPDVKVLYNVVDVIPQPEPAYNWNQMLVESSPVKRGDAWVQTWSIVDRPAEELPALSDSLKSDAYRLESDPLFFKAQRGEVTMQEWLDKVAEIKQRYSY